MPERDPIQALAQDDRAGDDAANLREAVEHLAAIERGPCSEGEREAAEWIARRLRELGCEAAVEQERAFASYAPALGVLGGCAVTAGLFALSGRGRLVPAAVAAACAVAIGENASNGPRLFRRLVMRRRPTWNVVARTGDLAADRTLVVLAHHDAHPTAFIFNQDLERWAALRFPQLFAKGGSIPFWWPIVAAPSLVAAGALGRRRGVTQAGVFGGLLALSAAIDISRNRIVPGANDNLSAVAGLIGLAQALVERPINRVRVLLVSCGSEETLQGGIYGFVARHSPGLDTGRTSFLNFELLGAHHHVLLEGEGPLRIEDYAGPQFRDLVARAAANAGVRLRRDVRLHVSTDSVVPSRAGYPTTTLITLDDDNMIPNYHLMTDTPENLDYAGIEGAVRIAEAVAGEVAQSGDRATGSR